MTRRYEFYVRVTRTISHSFTALIREMLSRQASDPGQWLIIEPRLVKEAKNTIFRVDSSVGP